MAIAERYRYEGQKYTASELAQISGLPIEQIRKRLEQGWTVEATVNIPLETPTTITKDMIGKQFHVTFNTPISNVFPDMQPKLGKDYIATVYGVHSTQPNSKAYFLITLENSKKLIVYPNELILGEEV